MANPKNGSSSKQGFDIGAANEATSVVISAPTDTTFSNSITHILVNCSAAPTSSPSLTVTSDSTNVIAPITIVDAGLTPVILPGVEIVGDPGEDLTVSLGQPGVGVIASITVFVGSGDIA